MKLLLQLSVLGLLLVGILQAQDYYKELNGMDKEIEHDILRKVEELLTHPDPQERQTYLKELVQIVEDEFPKNHELLENIEQMIETGNGPSTKSFRKSPVKGRGPLLKF